MVFLLINEIFSYMEKKYERFNIRFERVHQVDSVSEKFPYQH